MWGAPWEGTWFKDTNRDSPEVVKLMREHVDSRVKVKAAGGIRTADDFLDMVRAGAERIGCSAGIPIIEEIGRRMAETGTDTLEL